MYLAVRKLTVKACGYWFTAGGEKGSFGYYPHLKDSEGYPLYPDTQVHGDLKMAAEWLNRLSGAYSQSLLDKVFGKEAGHQNKRPMPAMLRLTDLKISDTCRNQKEPASFFQVKPRIFIDDNKHTVKKKMLVYREMAWLEGQTLEADLYIGYTSDRKELARACRMVEQAAQMLRGFGAHRSRGYGRANHAEGGICISHEDPESLAPREISIQRTQGSYQYYIRALVNFRNKGVAQSASMQVGTQNHISAQQFKAWFVRTYFNLFEQWPTDAQMGSITFPDLYPAACLDDGTKIPAWPVPASTMKYDLSDKTKIKDLWGIDKNTDQSNAVDGKPKPVGAGWFVTAGTSSKAFSVRVERRFRNRMDDNFKTVEKGLIIQALIPSGAVFGGCLTVGAVNEDFSRKAHYIFEHVKPEVNGCLFEPTLEPLQEDGKETGGPFLVTAPIRYTGNNFIEGEQVHMAVTRNYATTLKRPRPRRNRIVLAPGSILKTHVPEKSVTWSGFKKEIELVKIKEPPPPKKIKITAEDRPTWYHAEYEKIGSKDITRAQAGQLREFLHPFAVKEVVEDILEKRKEKHAKSESQENKMMADIDCACLACLQGEKDMSKLKQFIGYYLDDVALYQWEKRQTKGGGK
jgi:hypothetical protein